MITRTRDDRGVSTRGKVHVEELPFLTIRRILQPASPLPDVQRSGQPASELIRNQRTEPTDTRWSIAGADGSVAGPVIQRLGTAL